MIIPQSESAHVQAARVIERGGVIGYRTDTLYGLGADPANAAAVRRIIELKGREDGKPILLLLSDFAAVAKYLTHISQPFADIARRFWPGPLTLIGEAKSELPDELTAGTGTIGLRLPEAHAVRALVSSCGGALTATSANPSGRPAALTAEEVAEYFPELDLIIDGGKVTTAEPSTVLSVTGSQPILIREGAVAVSELQEWLA
jgi:L-threonylcarbamoyladenylate synthase